MTGSEWQAHARRRVHGSPCGDVDLTDTRRIEHRLVRMPRASRSVVRRARSVS
ncbi:hypothetical protein SAMN05216371_5820 [Streptomyces sp. TLI_053]|nr:hypothetical protein SAMN05216371_5820 [Streptomyces sp. TLI_053]